MGGAGVRLFHACKLLALRVRTCFGPGPTGALPGQLPSLQLSMPHSLRAMTRVSPLARMVCEVAARQHPLHGAFLQTVPPRDKNRNGPHHQHCCQWLLTTLSLVLRRGRVLRQPGLQRCPGRGLWLETVRSPCVLCEFLEGGVGQIYRHTIAEQQVSVGRGELAECRRERTRQSSGEISR